jgi:hypothetical protein
VLTDGGMRLSAVVSGLHGASARAMIKGLLAGEPPEQVLSYASKRLKASEEELRDALDGELSDTHRFVLREILAHIEELEARIHCELYRFMITLQRCAGAPDKRIE